MAKRPSPTVRAILICLILIGFGVLLGAVYLAQRMAALRYERSIAEKAEPVLLPPVDVFREQPETAGLVKPAPAAPPGDDPVPDSPPEQTEPDSAALSVMQGTPGTFAFPRFPDRLAETGMDLGEELTIADFNGDHLLDLVTVLPAGPGALQLYLNGGDGHFNAVSPFETDSFPEQKRSPRKMLPADFDNDGDLDLFVLGSIGHESQLLRNEGNGVFEVAAVLAATEESPASGASWVDFDRDGWIDLCIPSFRMKAESLPCHRLLHNQGDGTFRDLGWTTGFAEGIDEPGGHLWEDFDADGFPDFVCHPLASPKTGDPQPLSALRSSPSFNPTGWRFHAFNTRPAAADFGRSLAILSLDFDNDGRRDLFFGTATDTETGWLFHNRGFGEFRQIAKPGITGNFRASSGEIADLDLDGYEDVILGTPGDQPNRVFLNDGGDTFREVALAGGFGILQETTRLCAADLDADGDPDLLASVTGTRGALLENPGFEGHAWLALDLEGVTANRSAMGARVSLMVRDRDYILHRIERVARGPRVELGLGEAMNIESLEIGWPVVGWPVSRFSEIPMNRLLHIREGDAEFKVIERKPFKLGGGERRTTEDKTES